MPHPHNLCWRGRGISRDKLAGTNATQTICPPKAICKLAPPCNRVPGQAEQIFKLRVYRFKIAGGFFCSGRKEQCT